MLSVWVLALCLLISGRISEGNKEQKSSEDAQLDGRTSTTSLSGPIFSYFETDTGLEKYQDAWKDTIQQKLIMSSAQMGTLQKTLLNGTVDSHE
uniref:Putative lipocalin n=1 Tax=Ixodes ricinus TaxID=34613 RepID=A0A090XAP2_IXORI